MSLMTRLPGSSACPSSSAGKGRWGAAIVHVDGLRSLRREGIRHTLPRDVDEAGVWAKSSVQAVEGFRAGHRPGPQVSLLKPLLLLLTSDRPEVVHRHSGNGAELLFPGGVCTCGPCTSPSWCFLDRVQLSFHMENLYLRLVSPPDRLASGFCYRIFINREKTTTTTTQAYV